MKNKDERVKKRKEKKRKEKIQEIKKEKKEEEMKRKMMKIENSPFLIDYLLLYYSYYSFPPLIPHSLFLFLALISQEELSVS